MGCPCWETSGALAPRAHEAPFLSAEVPTRCHLDHKDHEKPGFHSFRKQPVYSCNLHDTAQAVETSWSPVRRGPRLHHLSQALPLPLGRWQTCHHELFEGTLWWVVGARPATGAWPSSQDQTLQPPAWHQVLYFQASLCKSRQRMYPRGTWGS